MSVVKLDNLVIIVSQYSDLNCTWSHMNILNCQDVAFFSSKYFVPASMRRTDSLPRPQQCTHRAGQDENWGEWSRIRFKIWNVECFFVWNHFWIVLLENALIVYFWDTKILEFRVIKKEILCLQGLTTACKALVWGSVYLDAHGEEDRNLRRGKPLKLAQKRWAGMIVKKDVAPLLGLLQLEGCTFLKCANKIIAEWSDSTEISLKEKSKLDIVIIIFPIYQKHLEMPIIFIWDDLPDETSDYSIHPEIVVYKPVAYNTIYLVHFFCFCYRFFCFFR